MTAQQTCGAAGTACQWKVNGLKLAGLSWGEPGGRPLLALHGWLDNAASFSRLAPLLEGYHVVAPDLTGHGQSARRSADSSYQIWDDLPEMLAIVDEMGWSQFDLLGHSRGAIISALLAAAFPERVNCLVLLDAVAPQPVPEDEFPQQMRRALLEKPALMRRRNRRFKSAEEAIASREARGLTPHAARELAMRNLRSSGKSLTWSTDMRLQGASAVKLTEGQIAAVLGALRMPVLLMLSAQEREQQWSWMEEFARRHIPAVEVDNVQGGHHFHMEEAATAAASRILQFLNQGEGASSC